jgi:hypothetical protein
MNHRPTGNKEVSAKMDFYAMELVDSQWAFAYQMVVRLVALVQMLGYVRVSTLKSRVSNPRPARLCYAIHSHIYKLCLYYKAIQKL